MLPSLPLPGSRSGTALPQAERDAVSRRQLWVRFWKVVVPPIMLVVAVLGSIVFGLATPTEAAAMGI